MTGTLGWVVAGGGGILVAAIAYLGASPGGWRALALPVLRAIGAGLLLAALLDLPIGRLRPRGGITALDASASLARADATGQLWRAARDSATRAAGDLLLFGDSVRSATPPAVPIDATSGVDAVVARAVATVAPLTLITDGVGLPPLDVSLLPAGSRVVVVPRPRARDAALVDLAAPPAAQVGDTIVLQARVLADAAMPAGVVRWVLDRRALGETPIPALAVGGEAVVEARLPMPPGDPMSLLRAVVVLPGDVEPRNDTVSQVVVRGTPPQAVVVSTAPDPDVREVAGVLRRSGGLPVVAFYRVAPGRWVRDGSLAPVTESLVREAARAAALVVLHGDTALFGAPWQLPARGALLLAPPAADGTEWFLRAAPPSPVVAAFGGLAVDSLPPIGAGTPPLTGTAALYAARSPTASVQVPVMTLHDGARRRAVFTGTGYARWRTRGGVAATSFTALVGGVVDWLLAARGSGSAGLSLATATVRAGEVLTWRRGADSVAVVVLRSDAGQTRRDTVRFRGGSEGAMAPLPAGIWRGTAGGAAVTVAVNASREWLPLPVTLASSSATAPGDAPARGARSSGWPYLAALLALVLEWWGRRGAGLR